MTRPDLCTICDGQTPSMEDDARQIEDGTFGPEEVGLVADSDGVWHNADLVVLDDQWNVSSHG